MNGCNPESGSSGVIRLDTDLCIIYLDQAAAAMLELPSSSPVGKKIDEVADLANLGNLMHGGISFSDQVILVGKRRIACDFVPIMENDLMVGGVLSLLRLIPDNGSDTDDSLKEILRSTSAFMNFDYDGIIVVDRKGIVVMVNQSFANLLDTTPQAMIGRHVDRAYRNSQPSHLPAVMESGKPDLGIIHYFNGKQVYANRFPLIKDGRVIGCVGKILFMDIREIPLIARQLQAEPESQVHHPAVNRKEIFFKYKYDSNSIVGQSRKIQDLKETLLRVAQKHSNVLLRGESGTGKELFAHAIHAASARHYSPFVKVNCAAIPEHLLESELFGYAEGAFTGAKKGGQIGKFEQAHTGTIFLDEIGDMPLYMQVKILRVLQEKELTNLGSTKQKTVDVRVVAATNRNLEQMVKEGKFREDLYYRLNVVNLTIPALRERKEDVYSLTMNFIEQFNVEFGLSVKDLDSDAWQIFKSYDWPGNIRELRNVVESAFNVVSGPLITSAHLPEQLTQLCPGTNVDFVGIEDFILASLGKKDISQIMDQFENLLLRKAVEFCHGNKQQASKLLGISRQGLYKKLSRQLGGGSDMDTSEM
ncbi:sigma 54-interacting transcriptional regulator [Geotalea sp. SG265]|uniref:sigma 54-interacting transcriptional regulator n=1 Tax=Geotalea sp. SG265 TaxID=2922867 RepID=UPI001FAEFF91|nr:sigma 54-interacting transcriptional regulator [Geotalea sp. SG265]